MQKRFGGKHLIQGSKEIERLARSFRSQKGNEALKRTDIKWKNRSWEKNKNRDSKKESGRNNRVAGGDTRNSLGTVGISTKARKPLAQN